MNNVFRSTFAKNYTTEFIDITRVINIDYFNSLGKVLKCHICGNVLNNPFDCDKCGNSFCFDCISKFKCPFNGCESTMVKPSSQGIKYLLSNLLIRCIHPDCKEEVNYNSLPAHEANCELKIVNCSTCGDLLRKKDQGCHKCDTSNINRAFGETVVNNNVSNMTNCVSINISIPHLVRQTERDFNNISRQTNKIKNEISQNMDTLFKSILMEKKKKGKRKEDASVTEKVSNETLKEEKESKHDQSIQSDNINRFFVPQTLESHQIVSTTNQDLLPMIKNQVDQIATMLENLQNAPNRERLAPIESKANFLSKENLLIASNDNIIQDNKKDLMSLQSTIVKSNEDVITTLKLIFKEFKEIVTKESIKTEVLLKRTKGVFDSDKEVLYPTPEVTNNMSIARKLDDMSDKITSVLNLMEYPPQSQSTIIHSSNTHSLIQDIAQSFTESLDEKLSELEAHNQENLKSALKELLCLKWCNQCQQVDYFYGFLTCPNCNEDYCKGCVLLCKLCKTLYCKNCIKCPACNSLICNNCRYACENKSCLSKVPSQQFELRYCMGCIATCSACKSKNCTSCQLKCFICAKGICVNCSKCCAICNIASCIGCGSIGDFKICFTCNSRICNNCLEMCIICGFEVCKRCIFKCTSCNRNGCPKNLITCCNCKHPYCSKCSLGLKHVKCSICHMIFCEECSKSQLTACKKCGKYACRGCYTVCRKCKTILCKDCKIRCENCNDISCGSCSYKCVCGMYIFCEKCLFDINPISPHDCIFFMNERPLFQTSKTRSKLQLPNMDFEAKFYIKEMRSKSLLIGVTDNSAYEEDSVGFIDNIWVFRPYTGGKYSSQEGSEEYISLTAKEGDSVMILKVKDELYFRVNYEISPLAYSLKNRRREKLYIYLENDSIYETTKVVFVYIRPLI